MSQHASKGRKKKGGKAKEEDVPPEYKCDGPTTDLSTMVCLCSESKEYEVLDAFLNHEEYDINERDSHGLAALHFAVFKEDLKCIKKLVMKGASCNIKDNFGFTPLFYATGRFPNPVIADYLIGEGKASVHAVTETGASALHGAALQGNLECMKVLVERGADPRCENEENQTPLDLAADEHARKLLHKVLRKHDRQRDELGQCCANCGKSSDCLPDPSAGLKRCSQCNVTLYCSRACQIKHWKEGGHKTDCCSFVIGYPDSMRGQYMMTFSHKKRTLFQNAPDEKEQHGFLKNKQFIVKVQVPLDIGLNTGGEEFVGQMMVYNEDRTVHGFISTNAKGYRTLKRRIEQSGVMGIKAYFWAELAPPTQDGVEGLFKVFHGRTAPVQSW